MASDDAKIRMDGDTTPARAALQQVVAELRKMEGSMAKMSTNSQKQSRSVAKELNGIQKAGLGAVKGLAGFVGITSFMAASHRAAALFRAELEAIKRIDMTAAEKNTETASAIERFRGKVGSGAGIDFEDFRSRAVAVSSDVLPPSVIIDAASDAISAGYKPEQREARKEIALTLAKMGGKAYGEDGFKSLVASLGTLSDKVEGFDIVEATTLAISALNFSPASDIQQFGDNILRGAVPVLVNNEGFSLESAVQYAAASQVTSQDIEGSRTRTNLVKQIGQARRAAQAYGINKRGEDLMQFVRGDTDEAKQIRHDLLVSANTEGVLAARKYKEALDAGNMIEAENIQRESAGVAKALMTLFDKKKLPKLKSKIEGKSTEKFVGEDFMQAAWTETVRGGFNETLADAKKVIRSDDEGVRILRDTAEQNRNSPETREATLKGLFSQAINVQRDVDREGGIRGILLANLRELRESMRSGTEFGRGVDDVIGRIQLLDATEPELLSYAEGAVGGLLEGVTTELVPGRPFDRSQVNFGGRGAEPSAVRRSKTSLTERELQSAEALIQVRDFLQQAAKMAQVEREDRQDRVVEAIERQTAVLEAANPSRPPNYKPIAGAVPGASQTSAE